MNPKTTKFRKLAMQRAQNRVIGCFITGARVQHGHNVPNSNHKTKKIFKANDRNMSVYSEALGKIKVKMSTRGLRTVAKYGGIDNFVLKAKNRKLTLAAKRMKSLLNKIKSVENVQNITATA